MPLMTAWLRTGSQALLSTGSRLSTCSWLSTGSSIGLRERRQGRWVLPRRQGVLETPWGPVAAKQVRRPDGRCTVKAEADALEALQASAGCALDELRAAVAVAPFVSTDDWA